MPFLRQLPIVSPKPRRGECGRRLARFILCVAPAALAFVIVRAAEPNGESTRLLRSPTVSSTHIAFAYANNIWSVERAGDQLL